VFDAETYESEDVFGAVDVFAFGMTLWALAAEQRPFARSDQRPRFAELVDAPEVLLFPEADSSEYFNFVLDLVNIGVVNQLNADPISTCVTPSQSRLRLSTIAFATSLHESGHCLDWGIAPPNPFSVWPSEMPPRQIAIRRK
jgi:hypothetical protein